MDAYLVHFHNHSSITKSIKHYLMLFVMIGMIVKINFFQQVSYPVLSVGVLPDVRHPGGPRPPYPPRPRHATEDPGR